MPITFLSATFAEPDASSTVFSFPRPAGLRVGDVLVLVAGLQALAPTLVSLDWTTEFAHQGGTDFDFVLVASHLVNGAEPGVMAVRFSIDVPASPLVVVLAYRGAREPPETFAIVDDVGAGGATTSFTCPLQTVPVVGDLYIGIAHIVNAAMTIDIPTSVNTRFVDGLSDSTMAVIDLESTDLIVGDQELTAGLPAQGSALSFVLRAAYRTAEEQRLYDFALGALPRWIKRDDEFLGAAARMFGLVRATSDYLMRQTLITRATGPTATTPDWLAQHARDRGTTRQAGETDPALQQRLRVIPDALTRDAILAAANAILAAAGVAGEAALIELPRDGAWAGTFQPMTGTGGSFVAGATGRIKFTPDELPWAAPPFRAPEVFPGPLVFQISIGSSAIPANAEDAIVESLDGDAAVYPSTDAIPGADPALTWVVNRFDTLDVLTDGFARAYAGRGWRAASSRPFVVLLMLPFGTSEGTLNSVRESIRQKKAAGFGVLVERRENP